MSIHSPKNKYSANIYFEPATKELGSVITFTINSVKELYKLADNYKYSSVDIYENKETYPKFNWVLIARRYGKQK